LGRSTSIMRNGVWFCRVSNLKRKSSFGGAIAFWGLLG